MSTPRLGEVTPISYTCNREIGAALCGEPAVLHVAWDATLENSLACVEHGREALADWNPYDWHPVSHACPCTATWVHSGTPGDSFCQSEAHPDMVALSVALDASASA